ncbi:MAG: hypothetical protein KGM24_06375 [Elusimicrobia bacterium]|nr:hypothetical protein [Elusimicrobiota bacterium]
MSGAWGVFALFVIPVGGGIPAGVAFGRYHGVAWPAMELLYFLSDVLLASVFEPLMRWILRASRRVPALDRFKQSLKNYVLAVLRLYGPSGGPFALILIAFAVDPMTGRAATHAAGHGVVAGWAMAIAGDMLYFTLIMASTLWLNSILGSGVEAATIVTVAMFAIPYLIQKRRESRAA